MRAAVASRSSRPLPYVALELRLPVTMILQSVSLSVLLLLPSSPAATASAGSGASETLNPATASESPRGVRAGQRLRHRESPGGRGVATRLPFGIPRVAGLSVTVDDVTPSGAGMEVDFSVQLTTVREVPLSFTGYPGTTNSVFPLISAGYGANVGTFTAQNQVATFTGGSPQRLGTLNETITDIQTSTYLRDRTLLRNLTATDLSAGPLPFFGFHSTVTSVNRYSTQVQQRVPGALPGIDFGDGLTQATTTLPLTSIVSTLPKSSLGAVGLRTSRFRRSSLIHTFADRSPKTITVNSGCCSAENFPFDAPGTGTSGMLYRAGTFASSYDRRYQTLAVGGTFAVSQSLVVGRNQITSGPQSSDFNSPGGSTFSDSFTSPYLVDQVSATAVASLPSPILEVPSLTSVGAGILAISLSLLGIALLRRA